MDELLEDPQCLVGKTIETIEEQTGGLNIKFTDGTIVEMAGTRDGEIEIYSLTVRE
jgi:hypothetical protein